MSAGTLGAFSILSSVTASKNSQGFFATAEQSLSVSVLRSKRGKQCSIWEERQLVKACR